MRTVEELHAVGFIIGRFEIEELGDFLKNRLGFTKFYNRFNGQFQGFELLNKHGYSLMVVTFQRDEENKTYITVSTSVKSGEDLRIVLETVVDLTNQGYKISWYKK